MLLLFLGLTSFLSKAQQPIATDVKYYGVEDGLPHRAIYPITQDSLGFIWVGTLKNGLARFDGHEFKHFTKSSHRLKSDDAFHICRDANGLFWVIAGLPWSHSPSETSESLVYNGAIKENDINIFNPYTFDSYSLQEYLEGAFPEEDLQKISMVYASPDGTIYLSLVDGRVYEFNPSYGLKTRDIDVHQYQEVRGSNNSRFNQTLFTHLTEAGLSFTKGAGKLFKNTLTGNYWYLEPDRDYLLIINPETGVIHNFGSTNPELFDGNIHSIYFDNQNNAWVASDIGLYRVQFNQSPFKKYLSLPLLAYKAQEAFSSRAISVTEDELLVNSNLARQYKVNLKTGEKQNHFQNIGGEILIPLIKTEAREYYTAGNSLYYLKSDRTVQQFNWANNEYLAIWTIYKDQKQQVWLGTDRQGLGILQEGQLSRYEHYNEHEELKYAYFWEFLPWDQQRTLTATSEGIYVLDSDNGVTHKIQSQTATGIGSLHYLHIYRDKDQPNVIWGGTTEGLVRLTIDDTNWQITDYQHFTVETGLGNNTIYAVYEDDDNNLWLPSDYGIICFNKKDFTSKSYTTLDGVSYNEFNRESHFQDEKGTLYFGSMNGLTVFNPEEVLATQKRTANAPLRITDLQQFNGKANKIEDKTVSLFGESKITLQPEDKFFSFKVSLLEFTDAKQHKYSYRISGQSDEWVYLSSNQLMVSGLPYGNHNLEIRAQGISGQFVSNLSVPIQVVRPFYLKWWFISLLSFIALALVYLWNKQREQSLKNRQAELEVEVEIRTRKIQEDKKIIEKQASELKNLDTVKSNFFANISHELRTPITLITSPIEAILARDQINSQDATHLEMVKRNGLRLKKMVDEILDLTKLEANKLELNLSSVHWFTFIKPILAGFESIADSRSINYKFDHKSSHKTQLRLDKQKLEIVISNLLSNAFKFTESGEILFRSSIDNGLLIISLKDTGRGIHTDDLPHLFERFFQTKNKDASSEGGTGIGLALSYELVQLMNGQIRVESQLGVGTTFHVEIPIVEVLGQTEYEDASEVNELMNTNDTIETEVQLLDLKVEKGMPYILLVEDNPDLAQLIESLLSGLYIVRRAHHGKSALELLENEDLPDLIISDLMMPIMDGFQLLQAVKAEEKFGHIPYVMLTARTATDDKLKALRIGVDDYLTKPFINEELLVRIENLLNNAANRKLAKMADEQVIGPEISQETQIWLDELEQYVLNNIDNLQLSVDDMAEAMNSSSRQFYRQIKQWIGVTPNQYLKAFRLNYARKLLENKTKNSVKAVAHAVGFPNIIYFSREFKKEFGRLPSDYL